MKNFAYHRPASVDEAAKHTAAGATPLAGGMTLLPTMKQQLAEPPALVDLSGIAELSETYLSDKHGLVVGAMMTHAQVAASDTVRENIPGLAQLASGVGDPQVRHCGTLGGSLANNDPAADYPAALLALDGEVHTNRRGIPASEYFQGLFTTALEEGELIRHVHLPLPVAASAYMKFRQPASLYALVGVFVAKTDSGVRVAVTGAGAEGVFRAAALEERLNADFSAAAVAGVQVDAGVLLSDIHGSADYRAALITTLTARAVASI